VTAQLRSELLKVRTTRTVSVLLAAALALAILGVLVEGLSVTVATLSTEDTQRSLVGDYGASNGPLLAAFAGLLLVTGEFRYGTIRPTLLFEPRRRVVLAAKLVAAALVGGVFGLACVVVSFGAGVAVLAVRDVPWALTGAHAVVLAVGPVAAAALTATIGVAIGALVRNQVGAIVALVVYAFVVEGLVFAAVPAIGRYLPAAASSALGGIPDENLLAPGVAAAVVLAWAAAFAAAAVVRTERSDV
jgi:ABC-type transport system involved in multi-copper enzyme maturation permease subunit